VIRGALPALERAAEDARRIAIQTGTELILMRNEEICSLPPEEIANSRDVDLLGGTEEPKRPTRASVVRSVVRLPTWCSV